MAGADRLDTAGCLIPVHSKKSCRRAFTLRQWILCLFAGLGGVDDGIVVEDPVLHVQNVVGRGGAADDDLRKTGVDDHPAAHRAGEQVRDQLARGDVAPGQIDRAADALAARGGDDGVHLGVDAAAELIALAGGDAEPFADAVAEVDAVAAAARCAVVARGNDLVVADDERPGVRAAAGRTLQHGLRDVEVIAFLIDAPHGSGLQ